MTVTIDIPIGQGFLDKRKEIRDWIEKQDISVHYTNTTLGNYPETKAFAVDLANKQALCLGERESEAFMFFDCLFVKYVSIEDLEQKIHDNRGRYAASILGLI